LDKGLFHRVLGELEAREKTPGLSMSELLTLPEPLSGLLNWMIRQGQVALAEIITFLKADETQARLVMADLLERGFIREIEIRGVTEYRVRLAPKRGRALPSNLWQALSDKVEGEEQQP
jgi:Fic family protein